MMIIIIHLTYSSTADDKLPVKSSRANPTFFNKDRKFFSLETCVMFFPSKCQSAIIAAASLYVGTTISLRKVSFHHLTKQNAEIGNPIFVCFRILRSFLEAQTFFYWPKYDLVLPFNEISIT